MNAEAQTPEENTDATVPDMPEVVVRAMFTMAKCRWPDMTEEDFADLPVPIEEDLEREASILIGEIYAGLFSMGLTDLLHQTLRVEELPEDWSDEMKKGVQKAREFIAYQASVLMDMWNNEPKPAYEEEAKPEA